MIEWVAIVIGGYVAYRLLGSHEAGKKVRAEENRRQWDARYELQFWHADHGEVDEGVYVSTKVHFPSMLMAHTFVSDGDERYRHYRVRRRADGVWERMPTEESFEMVVEAIKGSPSRTTRRVTRRI